MIGLGWLTLKQAQDAIRAGRLDEANQLLSHPQVQGHRRYGELLQELTKAYVDRGEKHLRKDDSAKAWSDLLKAEQLGTTNNAAINLREQLTRLGLAEVRAILDAGQPKRALDAINTLRERTVHSTELEPLAEAAKEWTMAGDYVERGEYARAAQVMDHVGKLIPGQRKAIGTFQGIIQQRKETTAPLITELHNATSREQWHQVLELTEKILALAPQHAEVRRMRNKAWKAVEPSTVIMQPPKPVVSQPVETSKRRRLVLWIDGVGGYLLLLENEITIGQAGPDSNADIKLNADISRNHAKLTRDSEGYLLDAYRPVAVNAKNTEKALLQSGDRLTLGPSCQLQFHQDAPVSASARLSIVSGQRFGEAVDGVLLMADSLILGPGKQSHLVVPHLHQPIILFRAKNDIGIRSSEDLFIDGDLVNERGILQPGCHVSSEHLSLSLEAIR